MFGKFFDFLRRSPSRSQQQSGYSRKLGFEQCESRCMLAVMTDIIFMADESGSTNEFKTQAWLASIVDDLDASLKAAQPDIDIRYGLVGFGEDAPSGPRFAHSQLVEPGDLFTNQQSVLATAIADDLRDVGGDEDGWDAIEHAIAEYDIRPEAVPVFVLLQNEEGRVPFNDTLTRQGILSALESKNAILNVMTVGNNVLDGNIAEFNWLPLFDLSPYEKTLGAFDDIRILGVEADAYGFDVASDPTDDDLIDAVHDGQHDFRYVDIDPANNGGVLDVATATESNTLQISYNGSNTGATGMVATGKSILIGENITGGIGGTLANDMQYRAKSVAFDASDDLRNDGNAQSIGTNSAVVLGDNENLSGFSIDFFGTQTLFRIHADGVITMDGPDGGTTIQTLSGPNVDLSQSVSGQSRPTDPTIAVLWDNLTNDSNPSDILWKVEGTGSSQKLIVQWNELEYNDELGSHEDRITFQTVLYADGRIKMNYFDLDTYNNTQGTVNETGGISATVGIWGGSSDTLTVDAGKFVPGLHSIGGTIFRFVSSSVPSEIVDTNDSYIRMAWDTGGAAWDIGVVDAFGVSSPEANALRDAFVDSLGDQILRADAAGNVFRADQVLLALNVGGSSGFNAGAAGFFRADNGDFTAAINGGPDTGIGDTVNVESFTDTSPTVDVMSTNSIPADDLSAPELQALETVFASARGESVDDGIAEHISFTIDMLDDGNGTAIDFENGTYIVELYFAEISGSFGRDFEVLLENTTVLDDYRIEDDHTKIVDFGPGPIIIEHDSEEASTFTGFVKRYEVDVTGDNGLQIDLLSEDDTDPILNGIRILKADPPRVVDVVVKGSGWASGVDYSFAELVGRGEQFRPIPTEGAGTIEIHFDSPVTLAGTAFQLLGKNDVEVPFSSFGYDPVNYIATWTFSSPLPSDKYAIHLTASVVTGGAGSGLDSDWTNDDNDVGDMNLTPNTADDLSDDVSKLFVVGDGVADGAFDEFRFHFAYLPGDYNGNGDVEAIEGATGDGNGDGNVDALDDNVGTLGDKLPLRAVGGADFSGMFTGPGGIPVFMEENEVVDGFDLAIWEHGLGGSGVAGDANGDGLVNGADFMFWQTAFGSFSAWYTGPPMLQAGNAATTIGLPPQVLNVIISGSASTHNPFSFDTVDGSGDQLKTVGVGGADTVSIVLSENVNVSAASLYVVGLYTANLPVLAEFSYDAATYTATWRFESWALGDQYVLSLSDMITDVDGNRLDGEWVNPASTSTVNSLVSTFPSGDGIAGGRFNFVATILPGDLDLNGIVDDTDLLMYDEGLDQYGHLQSGVLWSQGDLNGDGVVDELDDWNLFVAHEGLDLQDLWVLADFDGDYDVDDTDIALIADNIGMTGATLADGDLNGDGVVDLADLDLAFAQYSMDLAVVS